MGGGKINAIDRKRVRQREAQGGLQRPFHMLLRRELFGWNRYRGDLPQRDECLSEAWVVRTYGTPDPPLELKDDEIAF